MKNFFIGLLVIYQKIISPLLHQLVGQKNLCRYEVSCSQFAIQSIQQKGVLTGLKIATIRFLSCQPLAKHYEYN